MIRGKYKITLFIEKRIVLYLAEYADYKISDNVENVTQSGIQKAIRIRLEHVSRALKKLLKKRCIYFRRFYIRNYNRRNNVYFLNNQGLMLAEEIKFQLNDQWIHIRTLDQELRGIKYHELRNFLDIDLTPLEIYKYSSESKYHIIDLNKILLDKKRNNNISKENRT